MMKRCVALGFAVLLLLVAGLACVNQAATAENDDASTAAKAAAVSKIVFVDVEKCCQCTRDRVDKMWTITQTTLAGHEPAIPVERLHLDSQAAEVQPYRDMESIFAVPAIYLLDADGRLIKMFQGEATQAELSAVISG